MKKSEVKEYVLQAGVAMADISPERGVDLYGYPHFERLNTGVHDPLIASAMVLDDGRTRLAVVCMDFLVISRQHVQAIRRRASAASGIPADNIMISCSHTHSAPCAFEWIESDAPDGFLKTHAGYIAVLENKLVKLIQEAAGHLFEARVGTAVGHCGKEAGVGGNRRDPNGPADPDVWTIGVQDTSGDWKACLVRYSLHPTVIHEESTLVTADYPAYIRQELARRYPGMILLFAQGTSGDQSTRYFRKGQSFDEAERIGAAIGRAAGDTLNNLKCTVNAALSVKSAPAEIRFRDLPSIAEMEPRVKIARERWQRLKAADAPYMEIQNANLTMLGEEDTLTFARVRQSGKPLSFIEGEVPAEVQVIGIGDARIVGLPGEIFVEFGRRIRAGSPFPKTFVVTLANGYLPGYVCTAEAYAAGGYETGASMLTAQAGEALVETALRLLQK